MITAEAQPRQTTHGNYKCQFCPKTWKRWDQEFIENHIQKHHAVEAAKAIADRKAKEQERVIIKLQEEKADLERRLSLAQRPPEKKAEYYQAVLYCTNENKVMKAGMPKGVLVENVTCSGCGIKGALKITNNDPNWII